jgi:hypothetical protein
LDDGILGMIKELPEATALQALQKFASIDTQTMRSKNVSVAYDKSSRLRKVFVVSFD